MFRREEELEYHYRDVVRQQELLRGAFAGMRPQVDGWLEELDRTRVFYFNSITQLQLNTWSRGRVTLVGDAGVAGELARANGDHERAFASYERQMGESVRRSRVFARKVAKSIIPRGAQLISALPAGLTRAVVKMDPKGVRMHDSMPVKDYNPPAAS